MEMTEHPDLQVKNERTGSEILVAKKERIRKYTEIIIEVSNEKLDFSDFMEMILDWEEPASLACG